MELQKLKAKTRSEKGSGAAGRLRKTGAIPGVLYGEGGDAVSLTFDLREFIHLVHGRAGEHAIVQLEVEDNPELASPAILKDVQHHPFRGNVLHADFQRIRLDRKITTSVPVVLTGRSEGVTEGGVLDHQLREIEVECLALEVPDQFEVDITGTAIGDSIHVSVVVAPEGVTILSDPDRAIAAIHAPRLVIEEAAEAEGEEGEEGEEGAEGAEAAEGEEAAPAESETKTEEKK